jgi:putative ABC transport system permease protein
MPDWKDQIRTRLAPLNLEPAREHEIAEELSQHLEDYYEEQLRRGLNPAEAYRQTVEELAGGALTQELRSVEKLAKETALTKQSWIRSISTDLFQDLRYAFRMLRKNPGFAIVSVVTLALGIGINTVVFSVVNGVLLRPLPYPSADRLVWLSERNSMFPTVSISYPNFVDWQKQQSVFEHIGIYKPVSLNLTGNSDPQRVQGAFMSSGAFAALKVQPIIGRFFNDEDDKPGAPGIAVISQALWRNRFGGRTDIVDQSISINGQPVLVVGVMSPGFNFPGAVDLWLSLGPELGNPGLHYLDRGYHSGWFGVGRLAAGTTLPQAATAMDLIAVGLEREYPSNKSQRVRADSLIDNYVSGVSRAMWILLGAVALVLLIACANIANLMLTRASARHKEIAVRAALGAGQARIVRQLLSESLLIALIGGATGLVLARLGLPLVLTLANDGIPRVEEISLDTYVLLFAVGIACLTGMLFGMAPAWQTSRVNLQSSLLQKTTRVVTSASMRINKGLVIFEFALTLVLLVGAGLLLRTLHHLNQVDPGFTGERVLSFRFDLPQKKYQTEESQSQFYKALLEKLRVTPGVTATGVTSRIPLDPTDSFTSSFVIEGRPEPPANELPTVDLSVVSPGYFQTVGIPLIRGRSFNDSDDRSHIRERDLSEVDGGLRWMAGLNKIIVDEEFAKRYWPNSDPIGQHVRFPWGPEPPILEIVGVVRRVKLDQLADQNTLPQAYLPFEQGPRSGMAVLVKTTVAPDALLSGVRREVSLMDPEQPIYGVTTLSDIRDRSIAPQRLSFALLFSFALLALALAAVGIYGVLAQFVQQRTQEIGVRLALGAQLRDVLMLVLRDGMQLAVTGVAIGLVASLALSRLLAHMLFQVSPIDLPTFSAVSMLLLLVALLACLVPLRRAIKVDPLIVLRGD